MPTRLEDVHTPRPQGVLGAGDDMRVAVDVVRLAEHEHQLPESAEGGGVERGRYPQLREADPVRGEWCRRRGGAAQDGVGVRHPVRYRPLAHARRQQTLIDIWQPVANKLPAPG